MFRRKIRPSAQEILDRLYANGVDNWDGYSE